MLSWEILEVANEIEIPTDGFFLYCRIFPRRLRSTVYSHLEQVRLWTDLQISLGDGSLPV